MNSSGRQPTRRGFLAAGAALTAGAMLARADEPPLRVAVIGTGARGSDLLRALTTIDDVEIAAVCDDYPPHLEQGAKYAGPKTKTFADYRELLDKVKPQAVVIAVPLHRHYRIAADCLAAEADVFLEKTMCYSVEEAKKLTHQVAESQRVFQVGLQRRANAIYKQAAALIETGTIGQITAVKAQWHRHNAWRRPIPKPKTDPEWSALERRLNWRLFRESSGGLMAELGSHQLDVVNWFLGAPPKRVTATGGIDYWRDGREVFDNIFCVYEYEVPTRDRKSYTVRVSYSSLCNNAYEGAAELFLGTKGSLYLTSSKGLLFQEAGADRVDWSGEKGAAIVTAGKTLKLSNDPWAHRGKPVEIDIEQGDDTRDELVSFLDHVRRRDRETIADATVGLVNTATVMMANQAAETGRRVEFPN